MKVKLRFFVITYFFLLISYFALELIPANEGRAGAFSVFQFKIDTKLGKLVLTLKRNETQYEFPDVQTGLFHFLSVIKFP